MGLKKYAGDVVKEGKRIRWPKRDVLIPSIITVVVIAVFFGIMLLLEDWAGNTLLEILKDAFSNLAK